MKVNYKRITISCLCVFALFVSILLLCSCQSAKTYDDIYNEYSQKMNDATPQLLEEFNNEAKDVTDVSKLAQISNEKIQKLAQINSDGTSEMAQLQQKKGDDYSTYEQWAKKLYSVYESCSKQISNAYQEKATASLGSSVQSLQNSAQSLSDLGNTLKEFGNSIKQ